MLTQRPRPAPITPPTTAKLATTATPSKHKSSPPAAAGVSSSSSSAASMMMSAAAAAAAAAPAAPSPRKKIDHFKRWRPAFHLIAPKNWMNDPCGPCYDASTKLFHVLYQYNPYGATWGNMSWLHATSPDMVHWTHVATEPSLVPDAAHDRQGVFSGAMVPHGPSGEADMLTVFYTAVSRLPIHFTKPYNWGAEKLAMATSRDGGRSWQRDALAAVLVDSPPVEHMGAVASWRDPFISPWPAMDTHLGLPHDRFVYGVVSGSLRDRTPTAFLYRIDKSNMRNWTYVSTMANVGLNHTLGVASGDMGRNWEVCNFFSLGGGGGGKEQDDKTFLLVNVEGVGADLKGRHPMWARAALQPAGRSSTATVEMTLSKSGLVDHGCLYAATTFFHAPTQRRIMWGWITEDDLAEARYEQQGWSGCIGLPREVIKLTYDGVDARLASDPLVGPSFDVDGGDATTGLRLSTVGFRPAVETLALRQGAKHYVFSRPTANQSLAPLSSRKYELQVDIVVDEQRPNEEVGVVLYHNAAKTCGTRVVYRNGAVHVIRSASTRDPDVKTTALHAPLPLMRFVDERRSIEPVQMRIFVDNSVVEIFVNERAVITTRVYCDDETATLASLYSSDGVATTTTTATSPAVHARVRHVEAWAGLQSAMMSPIEGSSHDEVFHSVDSDVAHL